MENSRLSYRAALALLARDDERMTRLDRALGGILLLAAPFTAGASLALIDPKTELVALLRHVTDAAPARIKAARGKQHLELLDAAHTVLVLSAFFDAFRDEVGPGYERLALTDAEKESLLRSADHPDLLAAPGVPLPSVTSPFTENLSQVRARVEALAVETVRFVSWLAAWAGIRPGDDDLALHRAVTERALGYYRDRYVRLAADLPELAFWSSLDEHAATRRAVDAQAGALLNLNRLLATTVSGDGQASDVAAKLASQAAAVLDERIWRDTPGARFPLVSEGFVSPRFRHAVATEDARPSDESWWTEQDEQDELAEYLAHYLAGPDATRRPLIVLGHPGAGKSLLSRIVAARLPSTAYTAILVRLRRVDGEAEIYEQIEAALRTEVHERVDWGKFSRETPTTKVVIFDGFDELIQTTGIVQSRYLEKIAAFQAREWGYGHSVIPIVTSRTLVMDRTKVPLGSVLIKLEQFSDDQVACWVEAWNRTNAGTPGFRELAASEALHHGDVARQPLLLTLLAVYAVQAGVDRLDAEDLSGAELYRRLLDTFINRQIADKGARDLDPADVKRRTRQLRVDLSLAAFAMFSRGQQFLGEHDLGGDLQTLLPREATAPRTEAGRPVSRAEQALAAFFFIHVARSTEESSESRTYEFLHATFQEYLVAEFTVTLLRELAAERDRAAERIDTAPPTSPLLRELLSHQALFVRAPIVDFARQRLGQGGVALRDTAIELFRRARDRAPVDGVSGYAPTGYDPVRRLACYTANLVTLAVLCGDPVPVARFAESEEWTSTVRLWQSGVDAEGRRALFYGLVRTDEDLIGIRTEDETSTEFVAEDRHAAQLCGDPHLDTVLAIGGRFWDPYELANRVARDIHLEVLDVTRVRWPVPGLRTLLAYDQDRYRQLLAKLEGEALLLLSNRTLDALMNCLIDDGPQLPPDMVTRFARLLVENNPRYNDDLPGPHSITDFFRLSALALRCPYLWDDPTIEQALHRAISFDDVLPAFLLVRSSARVPRSANEVVQQRLRPEAARSFSGGAVSVEMIDHFTGRISRSAGTDLLSRLDTTPETSWTDLAPAVLQRFLAELPNDPDTDNDELLDAVNSYLRHHGRNSVSDIDQAIAVLGADQADSSA